MAKRSALALALRQNTPEWVDARADYIGSSDVPIITGSTPYATSAFALWGIKTRLAAPEPIDPDTQQLWDLGHALEPVIADFYVRETSRPVRLARRMLTSRAEPWASASLDRVSAVKGERRIVELKWVPRRHWALEGSERVPPYVQEQIQWQLFVTGWDVADVAVLEGSRVHVYEVGRDDEFIEDLVYIARHFFELVKRQTPPPVDGSDATRRMISRLHPRPTLDLMPASAELDALADDLRAARTSAKLADERRDQLENVLRLTLGEYTGAETDRYRISWKKNRDGTRTDWEAIARAQRKLIELLADASPTAIGPGDVDDRLVAGVAPVTIEQLLEAIETLYTITTEGARVLRVKFRSEEDGKWT